MKTCQYCGELYRKGCAHCAQRIKTWGIDGNIRIINMSRRSEDILIDELIVVAENYYIGKSKTTNIKVGILKTTLKKLNYKGKIIGTLRRKKRGGTLQQIRMRQQSLALRNGWRENCCKKCGSEDNVELHHIVPVSWGGKGEKENYITLCKKCHEKVHKKLNKYLNKSLLLKYLEPHYKEIEKIAKLSI